MCDPEYFGIDYEINPWMDVKNQPDKDLAKKQWENIKNTFVSLGINVDVMNSQKGLPDMVFTANAGLPFKDVFFLSNFKYKERRPESNHFRDFFKNNFEIIEFPEEIKFEGQGDAFFADNRIILGSGFRSSKEVKGFIKEHLPENMKIIQAELVNPNFYHLDTAIQYLGNDNFLAIENAFSEKSLSELKKEGNIIFLSEEDAQNFAANCIVFEDKIILNKASEERS